jgi:hypothetical protein
MKIWIDKHGGMHYHKPDCKVIHPSENMPHFHYEEIEHQIRQLGKFTEREYTPITIDGRRYMPCPFCFGYGGRR